MKDLGILKGLVQEYDTNDKKGKFSFFSLRKMTRDFLKKLNVSFFDPCCPELSGGFLPWNVPTGAEQLLIGEGAILLTSFNTAIETQGAETNNFVLGAGIKMGQVKKLTLIVDDGDAVIEINAGDILATFDDVGDYLLLQWNGSVWVVIENNGVVLNFP